MMVGQTVVNDERTVSRAQVLVGRYQGILRSPKGKAKGLWLCCGDQQYAVALPKYLRPMLVRELVPGCGLQVWALREDDGWRAVDLMPLAGPLTAARPPAVQSDSPDVAPSPSIQICGKGQCRKQGSPALWRSLQTAIAANPDVTVSVELVGCMKACKQGPNLRVTTTGQVHHHVTPARARTVLEALASPRATDTSSAPLSQECAPASRVEATSSASGCLG